MPAHMCCRTGEGGGKARHDRGASGFHGGQSKQTLKAAALFFNCPGTLRNARNQVVCDDSYMIKEDEVFTWLPGRTHAHMRMLL